MDACMLLYVHMCSWKNKYNEGMSNSHAIEQSCQNVDWQVA